MVPFFRGCTRLFTVPDPFVRIFGSKGPLSSNSNFSVFEGVRAIFSMVNREKRKSAGEEGVFLRRVLYIGPIPMQVLSIVKEGNNIGFNVGDDVTVKEQVVSGLFSCLEEVRLTMRVS